MYFVQGKLSDDWQICENYCACVKQVQHLWESFRLSATCGIGESIIGAKEGGEGAGDGVAVGCDRGSRRHPVVQDALLSPIPLLVLLQGGGLNLHLEVRVKRYQILHLSVGCPPGSNPKVDTIRQKWTTLDKSG